MTFEQVSSIALTIVLWIMGIGIVAGTFILGMGLILQHVFRREGYLLFINESAEPWSESAFATGDLTEEHPPPVRPETMGAAYEEARKCAWLDTIFLPPPLRMATIGPELEIPPASLQDPGLRHVVAAQVALLNNQACHQFYDGQYQEAQRLLTTAACLLESVGYDLDEEGLKSRCGTPLSLTVLINLDRIELRLKGKDALRFFKLACARIQASKYHDAEAFAQIALREVARAFGPRHWLVAVCLIELANCRQTASDYRKMDALLDKAQVVVEDFSRYPELQRLIDKTRSCRRWW